MLMTRMSLSLSLSLCLACWAVVLGRPERVVGGAQERDAVREPRPKPAARREEARARALVGVARDDARVP